MNLWESAKLQNLTFGLEKIVDSDTLEADDIFDHDYCDSSVK